MALGCAGRTLFFSGPRAGIVPGTVNVVDTNPKCANVFLVGLMGAGKSTVGKRLARAIGFEFLDSDQVIEDRTGASIPLIFEIEGETGFRARETRIIEELTQRRAVVLATGGGVVLAAENRARLCARGLVVYLHAPVDLLYARTRRDRRRPLLQTADPHARLSELFGARDPLYRECADLIVDTARRTVRELVEHIRTERDKSCAP